MIRRMDYPLAKNLGPIAALAGVWEGDKGGDVSPAGDYRTMKTPFRERMRFEPFGPIDNHAQQMWGLRYSTIAWRIGEPNPFHEETGYWLWDPRDRQVMRCFLVPRGVSVIAGGTVSPTARTFRLAAAAGSPTYGICSNKFLDREFKTVRFEMKVTVHKDGRFAYEEDTQLKMRGRTRIFHHRDSNTLTRVASA